MKIKKKGFAIMSREILTDEQIKAEKEEVRVFKEAKLKRDVDEMISEIESGFCWGRASGKNHYMRKIDSDGVAGQYKIKCEFCDIPGIKVQRYDVVNLRDIVRPIERYSDLFSPDDWHRCRAKINGLL